MHLEAHNVLQLLRGIPGLLSLDVFVDGGFPLKAIDVLTELCSSERQSWPEVTLRFRHADGPKPAMQDLDNLSPDLAQMAQETDPLDAARTVVCFQALVDGLFVDASLPPGTCRLVAVQGNTRVNVAGLESPILLNPDGGEVV